MMPALLAARAFAKRVPWQVWALLALCALVAVLRWHWIGVGVERCQRAQEAAEKRLDAKADRVAKQAQGEAKKARDTIRKESDDAQAEVRTIVRTLPATCPSQPDRLRELGDAAVQGARGEVLPAEGR